MKTFFLFALVLCTITSKATNYYFSNLSGDDSRTSFTAQNPATPWKTLNKLNQFFGSLQPGDAVLLKRGEIFYGSIIIKKSGTAAAPIVISGYGTGNNPVITSLVTMAGWVSKGNGIWEAGDTTLGSSLNMVLLNGVEQGIGRYPNSDTPNNGYLNFESHVGKTSITDDELTSSTNWAGAELVIRPRHWILDRSLITSQAGSTISYSSSSPYEPFENYGYFIQNSVKTLDRFGEWYYNPSTKKLSVFFGSNNPSSYILQAATMGDLVSSAKFSYIVFDGLTIRGANGSAFSIQSGTNLSIQNCNILFSGEDGFTGKNHTNLRIENCLISNQNNNGIDLETGDGAIIRNNKILNSYMIAGMGLDGEGMGIGINISSSNSIIEYNEIRNTGFQGIYFNGSNVSVKNNLIDSFCLTKDDGAGIYSTVGPVFFNRRMVVGNIIMNGIGTGKGTNDSNKVAAHGIYMDNNASGTDIMNNTIANCSSNGINIHNSFAMNIENNTVFNNKIQLNMAQDADNVPIRNCTLTNNILFSKLPYQWISSLASSGNDIALFGSFDSNYYARPLDDRITIFNNYVGSNGSGVTQNFDLDGWKGAYGKDEHSKITAKQIAPFKIDSLVGSNKFINGGDFSNDIKGISISSNSCTLSRNTSGLLDGGYLQVSPSSPGSSVYFKVGSVTAGKNYILSYSLAGSADSIMSIAGCLKQLGAPYAYLTPAQSRGISTSRTENQLIFSPTATETSAVVRLKVDAKSTYFIDNVKFFEASTKITDPDDSIRFEYNATTVSKSIALNSNYIDAAGKLYAGNITLQPYASAVLIQTSDTVKNIAPTVSITTPANNAVYSEFSSVSINAVAADAGGSISKVEFYRDSTLLKTTSNPPYNFTLDSIVPGNYLITAKATDNNGLTTASAAVGFSAVHINVAPIISITTPFNNSVFNEFAGVSINVVAADVDGSIAKVEFYRDSILLKTSSNPPYNFIMDSIAPGNYLITAKATDNSGQATISGPVLFSVVHINVAPTVRIITPANNAVFNQLSSVSINTASADVDGSIAKIECYNGSTLLKTIIQPASGFTIDNIVAGNYSITAKATDNNGLSTTSAPVVFSVVIPNAAPNVSITTPANNAVFSRASTVLINAAAADVDGSITRVEFYNGSTLLKIENKPTYDCTMGSLAPGKYTITAKAYDNKGLAKTSSPVVFSVSTSNAAPVISITSPTGISGFTAPATIQITAAATDSDGSISKVEFFNGSALLTTQYTYPYSWSWQNVPAGNYIITAKATDNTGLATTSAGVSVLVKSAPASRSSSSASPAGVSDALPVLSGVMSSTLADFRVSPNPGINMIQLYFDGLHIYQEGYLTIQNASGAIVKKYPVSISGKKIDVDISSLVPGIYIIGLSGENFNINKKFLKVN